MDSRIKELIDFTKIKFGLNNYYLQSYQFNRKVNIFNETVYTLSIEWFPNHIVVQEDDDLNPEGTASIEINLKNHKFESVIFVMGKTYAEDGVKFVKTNKIDLIKWIEQETGLTYGKQFQLHREEEGEFYFKECIEGVAVSPSGFIEVKFDQEGNLTLFSVHGQFPSKELFKEEKYSLSLDRLEHIAKEQLKLIEFPSYEQKRVFPVYAVEEIYVTNHQKLTIPFEVFVDTKSHLIIDKTIYWDNPINKSFDRKQIRWVDDVSEEQALSCEPSPDSFPISKDEQEQCEIAIRDFLRQEYPIETGNWTLKTLYRDNGYIHAVLRANNQDNRVFQRKMKIIIDAKSLQVVNYMDNKPMLEVFDQFDASEKVTTSKDEAYEKIKETFVLKPYYVYDFEQKQYILCGKLDCDYGVRASNGEVIALNDL